MLERRHYWRYVSFSDVAELYASRTLRIFALSMVVIFVGVYLYKNDYSLTFIMLYFTAYLLLRALLSVPLSFFIAKYGPKQSTLISNLLYVPTLLLLAAVPDYGLTVLIGAGILQALSVTLYDISYLVSFSKVRNDEKAGREIGYMHILEHIAKAVSPVVGGFIAYWISPQATLFFAATIFALAALPLFLSPEKVRTNQKISYYGLPWRKIFRTNLSQVGVGVDFTAHGLIWSLFIAIAVFGVVTDVVYAQLGVLSAVSVLAGIISARVFGLLVDRRRGNELLTVGVFSKALIHLGRVAVVTPVSVVLVNIFTEVAAAAHVLPYTKGIFAQADDLPGYRIVFITAMSISSALGAAMITLMLAGLASVFSEVTAMQIGFVISGLMALLILAHGFRKYLKPRFFF